MNSPQISVILPVHNRSSVLPRSISSVLWQTYSDLELIVVDDASTEDIAAIVDSVSDKRVRYVRRDVQGGPAAARNTGIRAARGTYLAFQDSDDEWLLEKLEHQMSQMSAMPDSVALISCGIVGYRPGSKVLPFDSPRFKSSKTEDPLSLITSLAYSYPQTWLVRGSAVHAAGMFDEDISVWEDRELFMRIAMRFEVSYFADVLVLVYKQLDSISLDISKRLHSQKLLLKKYSSDIDKHKMLVAWLAYQLGRNLISCGEYKSAARYFYRAYMTKPWSLTYLLWLIFSRTKSLVK